MRVLPLMPLLLSACTSPSGPRPTTRPPKPASRSYHVIDATPAFWTFWQAHAASPPQVQAAAFRRMVVGAHPELFTPDVIGVDPTLRGSDLEPRLGPYLASLPARIPVMRSVHARLAQQLGHHDRSFRTLFPDMRWSGTVYFTISVDAFDGSVRRVQDRLCLLFGIDKIAKVHGSGDLGPFFHHELFHVYHHGVNPPPPTTEAGPHGLLQPLWQEGLAVYVSHLLNPAASATELLLTREMVRDGPAVLPKVAAELQQVLLVDAQESQYRDLFLGRGQRQDIPRRFAYYVGYLVAKLAARNRPIARLVRLRGPELAQVVAHALSELQRLGHTPTVP